MSATVPVPGSKSATARALLLAALASGPGTVAGALEARDTALMRAALRSLGAQVDDTDPALWHVQPVTLTTRDVEIDCGLAGTVARFVPPVAALSAGTTRFSGDPAASRRPMAPLLDGLRQAGARVTDDRLPFSVTGPVTGGEVRIDAAASSQFVSGLLLTAARFPQGIQLSHTGPEPVPSAPYLELTVAALRARGAEVSTGPNRWQVAPGPLAPVAETVPPDLMNAAAFLAAAVVAGGRVTVPGWPGTELPGAEVPQLLQRFGAQTEVSSHGLTVSHDGGGWDGIEVDLRGSAELTPVVAVLAALAGSVSTITGIGHIRGHETDRVSALATELTRLGARVEEHPDALVVRPARLHGGLWHCYGDHRMAHAGALLGLVVRDVVLDDIGCTSKTLPQFPALWTQMVAA
ncbi:MAG: 3-phosphoshikimate 1-carboxyvinyltransferase [Actinomycetia bacterium]|nr:3-phosphoshikimate 1-carboxyvinyltransferase [Actinomycetes bacterium]